MLYASLAFFSLLLIRAMSYNLENSLHRVSSSLSIKSKLSIIKDIGHRSGLENLSIFATARLKELGLVTSSFSRQLRLYVIDDRTSGPLALFNIILRKIKNDIPYLGSGLESYLYTNRLTLCMCLVDTPAVSRYMTRYTSRLSDLTDNTVFITASHQNPGFVDYTLTISANHNRQASSYKVLKYLEHMIEAIHTLHRVANIPEATINVINGSASGEVENTNTTSATFSDDIEVLLGAID